MSKTMQREMTQGEQLRESRGGARAIDTMVGELKERSSQITAAWRG
ncbi:MAG: hypothetical protein R3B46_03105 [Phycisphaerales bacterium]